MKMPSEKKQILARLVHNARKWVDPLSEASDYQRLKDNGMTQAAIASRAGMSEPWVSRQLKLLQGSERIQEAITNREITPDEALKIICHSETEEEQIKKLTKLLQQKVDEKVAQEVARRKRKAAKEAGKADKKKATKAVRKSVTMSAPTSKPIRKHREAA